MADVKISALVANATPTASDVVAVSKSDNSATNKVTLGNVAALAISSAGAVPSDTTGISGASTITNIFVSARAVITRFQRLQLQLYTSSRIRSWQSLLETRGTARHLFLLFT